jgi:hypothetical protein
MAKYTDRQEKKFNKSIAELKEKYPNSRMTSYIDKMKTPPESLDSEQGKVSTAYGKLVDDYNKFEPEASPSREQLMDSAKEDKMKKGGAVSSASSRADGIAIRGKTRA